MYVNTLRLKIIYKSNNTFLADKHIRKYEDQNYQLKTINIIMTNLKVTRQENLYRLGSKNILHM